MDKPIREPKYRKIWWDHAEDWPPNSTAALITYIRIWFTHAHTHTPYDYTSFGYAFDDLISYPQSSSCVGLLGPSPLVGRF